MAAAEEPMDAEQEQQQQQQQEQAAARPARRARPSRSGCRLLSSLKCSLEMPRCTPVHTIACHPPSRSAHR